MAAHISDLKPTLDRSVEDAELRIQSLRSASDVADLLEIPEGQLLYILYKTPDSKKYRSFEIQKRSGGVRKIDAPMGGTAILLNKLKPILDQLYRARSAVHGFVPGRSIRTNAVRHIHRRFVLNVDLENFYGSINFGRVRGLFMAQRFGMGHKAASVLAHLCCFQGRLPQGSPVSPVLSNFVASDLDRRLSELARLHRVRYTRYADDITFSSSLVHGFPPEIAGPPQDQGSSRSADIGNALLSAITSSGFRLNDKKVRLLDWHHRQEVTGLTVNQFVNVDRRFVRRIRAMLHSWSVLGAVEAGRRHISKHAKRDVHTDDPSRYYRSVVYGCLAYLRQIRGADDAVYTRLALRTAELDPTPPTSLAVLRERHEMYDVFISHAGEDKATVARPIFEACERIGVKAFLDEAHIDWGDSLTEKINRALSTSKLFLAILSNDSVDKRWPKKEVNAALAREINGHQKFLPLTVGSVDISGIGLISDKLYLDWDNDPEAIAARLKVILSKLLED